MSAFAVTLRAFIPAPISNGWAWAPWTCQDPAGEEVAQDITELPHIIRTYARAVSVMIGVREASRFNVTAYGARSGRAYGRDQWLYDPHCRVFRPHGDPWVPLLDQIKTEAGSQPRVVTMLPEAPVHELRPGPLTSNVVPLRRAA